jgi:hypothetical protein
MCLFGMGGASVSRAMAPAMAPDMAPRPEDLCVMMGRGSVIAAMLKAGVPSSRVRVLGSRCDFVWFRRI